MRNIVWLTLLFSFGFGAKAQEALKSDVVSVIIPKEAYRLSIEDALRKISKTHLRSSAGFSGQLNIFDINGVVTIMRDDTIRMKENYDLEWHKSDLDGVQAKTGRPSMHSEIVTVNRIKFHVFQAETMDEGRLMFASDIKDRKMFFCKLIYPPTDRKKAQKAFDAIIKSFKYK